MQIDWDPSLPGCTATISADYETWLARGKTLADNHNRSNWDIGDWVVEGDDTFNVIKDIPRYLLLHKTSGDDGGTAYRSEKVPHFYKDISDATNLRVQTLRNLAVVCRFYKPDERIHQLSFTHHAMACGHERALEYLRACLVEGERPHTVAWLEEYIDKCEGKKVEQEKHGGYLYLAIPDRLYAKLKDLSKHYQKNLNRLIDETCVQAIESYIESEGEKISLQLFNYYEPDRWPFDKKVIEAEKKKIRTRRSRPNNDPVVREKRRLAVVSRWSRGNKVA